MGSIAYAIPLLPGRTDECRLISSECMGKRHEQFTAANRDRGIAREFNWIQKGPEVDLLITYIEAEDVDNAYHKFLESDSEFDAWYKEQLHYVSGIDFSKPGGDYSVTLLEIQGEAVAHAKPVTMVLPVLPGKTDQLKTWFEELKGPRRNELKNYLDRAGLAREAWYLQPGEQGDLLITYALVEDPDESMHGYAYSDHPFDVWVKQKLLEYTGVDLNAPKAGPMPDTNRPELILDWHHAFEAAA